MKKFKFNVKNVKIKDLNGVDFKEQVEKESNSKFSKMLGNFIYTAAQDLGMLELAQKIYKNQAIEMNEEENTLFKSLIEKLPYSAFIRLSITNAIVEDE